jgi:hypothetical protein
LAARTAPACRRSCTRRSGRPAATRAFIQWRRTVLECTWTSRSWVDEKSRASRPRRHGETDAWRAPESDGAGMATSRMPASLFGEPTVTFPSTRTTPRRTRSTPCRRSRVVAPQFDQLAEAQAAPRADEDERTEAGGHRSDDRFELGQRCRLDAPSTPRTASPLTRRRFAARTSSATAVDRISQEPVDLSPLGRLGRVQSTVPGAHYLGVMSLSETSLNSTSSRRRRRR